MKLNEFTKSIGKAFKEQRDEADVLEAISPNMKTEYDRALEYVHEAMASNKDLLGVYLQNGQRTPVEQLPEMEIHKRDLERFVLKLRHDLREHMPQKKRDHETPDDNRETCSHIIFRVVSQISNTLIGMKFGGVFSETEAKMFEREFPQLPQPEQDEPAPKPVPCVPQPQSRQQKLWERRTTAKKLRERGIKAREEAAAEGKKRLAQQEEKRQPEPIPSPSKDKQTLSLEELTRRGIEARRQAIRDGMSDEQRAEIKAIEERLRKEGKIL